MRHAPKPAAAIQDTAPPSSLHEAFASSSSAAISTNDNGAVIERSEELAPIAHDEQQQQHLQQQQQQQQQQELEPPEDAIPITPSTDVISVTIHDLVSPAASTESVSVAALHNDDIIAGTDAGVPLVVAEVSIVDTTVPISAPVAADCPTQVEAYDVIVPELSASVVLPASHVADSVVVMPVSRPGRTVSGPRAVAKASTWRFPRDVPRLEPVTAPSPEITLTDVTPTLTLDVPATPTLTLDMPATPTLTLDVPHTTTLDSTQLQSGTAVADEWEQRIQDVRRRLEHERTKLESTNAALSRLSSTHISPGA